MGVEEQTGFHTGRSTIDHTVFLTKIIEIKTTRDHEIPEKNTYDSVSSPKHWQVLESTNDVEIFIYDFVMEDGTITKRWHDQKILLRTNPQKSYRIIFVESLLRESMVPDRKDFWKYFQS